MKKPSSIEPKSEEKLSKINSNPNSNSKDFEKKKLEKKEIPKIQPPSKTSGSIELIKPKTLTLPKIPAAAPTKYVLTQLKKISPVGSSVTKRPEDNKPIVKENKESSSNNKIHSVNKPNSFNKSESVYKHKTLLKNKNDHIAEKNRYKGIINSNKYR